MRFLLTIVTLTLIATHVSAGDLAAGKRVFIKCKSCHQVGPEAKNKMGPTLNGVVGRRWGAVDGFKYSAGKEGTLLAANADSPKSWDLQTLSAYLRNPTEVIPNGKMKTPRLNKEEDVANVIYYLAQFGENGEKVDPDAVLSALEEIGSK